MIEEKYPEDPIEREIRSRIIILTDQEWVVLSSTRAPDFFAYYSLIVKKLNQILF